MVARKVKVLQSDNGGEHTGRELQESCERKDTIRGSAWDEAYNVKYL